MSTILAFTLSMPGCPSWNGRWSGEGRPHVIVRTIRKAEMKHVSRLLDVGYFTHAWPDGWCAGVSVRQLDAAEARKVRRSAGHFRGYDWFVDSLLAHGDILDPREAR